MTLELDLLSTIALAIGVLLAGTLANRHVGVLRRHNLPVPVVGGLLFAIALTGLHYSRGGAIALDSSMKDGLMLAFFATVGLGANIRLLRAGGPTLARFLVVAALFVAIQNTVGVAAAMAMDLHPLLGLLCGSVTLSGGHGTGAAYAQQFALTHNIQGVTELALASATFGLVVGGVVGGPVAARLIRKHALVATLADDAPGDVIAPASATVSAEGLLITALPVLLCLGAGAWLSDAIDTGSVTLPAFLWCLLVGVALRNVGELTSWYRIDEAALSTLGNVALSLFLALALMSLRLWELVVLAGPLLVLLAAQTLVMVVYTSWVTFKIMGSNYDAAVLCAGHCGFGMGATPTAVANIQSVTAHHGPSPEAFLIIPLVGAFFIDLVNALVIQGFMALPVFGF